MALAPPANPYIAGPPLESRNGFFNRQEILKEVEQTLRSPERNSVILYGQRRIGKTSLLLHLERELPNPPFFTIYFDLAGKAMLSVSQVLYEIAVAAANKVDMPAPAPDDFENNPAAFDQTFLPKLHETMGSQQRPVFLLDEFKAVDTPEEELPQNAAVRSLSDYFYDVLTTQTYADFVFAAGRRMKELSSVVESHFKADLTRFVPVLPPISARALILQEGREGIPRYDEAAIERILELTRGHPYLTQRLCYLLFDHAYDHSPGKLRVTVKDVDTVANNWAATGDESMALIWDSLPPAERIALAAAAAGAQKEGDILSKSQITDTLTQAGIWPEARGLDQAPHNLADWQMLEQKAGGYTFFIKLMQRWVSQNMPLEEVKKAELGRLDPAAESLYRAALAAREEGNDQQAIAYLRRALAINPNHLPARLLLGTILRQQGQLSEAVDELEEAYKLDRSTGQTVLVPTLLQLGAAQEEAGNYPGALASYRRALEVSPENETAQARRDALKDKVDTQATSQKPQEEPKERRRLWAAFIILGILLPLLCLLCLWGYTPFVGPTQQNATTTAVAEIAATRIAATVNAVATATAAAGGADTGPTTPSAATIEPSPTLAAQTTPPGAEADAAAATATAQAATAPADQTATPTGPLAGQIRIVGSSAMQPVVEALAQEFTSQHPGVQVVIQAGEDSQAGIEAVQQGSADASMVARSLDNSELAELGDLQAHTLTQSDVLAIIAHPLVTVDNLSTAQVQAIFSGQITNWSQVGGSDAPITVVNHAAPSDTRTAFEQKIIGPGGAAVPAPAIEAASEQAVRNLVSGQPYAIGYLPLRAALAQPEPPPGEQNWAVVDTALLDIKILALDQTQPSLDNAASGAYPLTRPLNLLTKKQPAEPVQSWIEFVSGPQGQEIVRQVSHPSAP